MVVVAIFLGLAGLLVPLVSADPAPSLSASPQPLIELSASRNFGYVIGDLIDHTITATVPGGYQLETEFLPRPGALNEWLEVRATKWDRLVENGAVRYRIAVTYQLFKGVRNAEQATIPPLTLRFRGPERREVRTPEWEFAMMPVIPPETVDANVVIRQSLPPGPIDTAPYRDRLLTYLAGLLITLGYFAWRRTAWSSPWKPFARAQRDLKKILAAPPSLATYRSAVQCVHGALNETAGYILFAGQLDHFTATRPAFAELRPDLADFFALSQGLFFSVPDAPVPPDYPIMRLYGLCRRCADAERRSL